MDWRDFDEFGVPSPCPREWRPWAAWQRVHAVDPQWCPDVIRQERPGEMQWERWDSWKRGDPRWRVHVIDTTNLTVAQVRLGARVCLGLRYRSENTQSADRAMDQAAKIAKRLDPVEGHLFARTSPSSLPECAGAHIGNSRSGTARLTS
jgi:hypothetical protein